MDYVPTGVVDQGSAAGSGLRSQVRGCTTLKGARLRWWRQWAQGTAPAELGYRAMEAGRDGEQSTGATGSGHCTAGSLTTVGNEDGEE